jgi:hypothetical protein
MNVNLKLYAVAFSCRWPEGTIRIEAGSVRAESQADAEWIGLKYFLQKYPNCTEHLCVVDIVKPENIPTSALQRKDPPPQRARVFELEIWLFVIRGGRLTSPSNLVEYAS